MLQFFDKGLACHVILNYPITDEDIENLTYIFGRDYISWHVEFGHIYMVNAKMINLLYLEIQKNRKSIYLITHKSKLNRYFHKLGFRAYFESLVKDDIVNNAAINIVLIGGSANSSEKILAIVKNISLDNLTLIIVQHIEPNREGMFDNILKKYITKRVSYVKDGEKIEKGTIYLCPKDKHLKVKSGHFELNNGEKYNFARPSISISYESFSNYYKESLLVIQECGYASDGVDKIQLLHDNGSKIIIQDAAECEAKSMVDKAQRLNLHDYKLQLKEIIMFINYIDKKESDSDWVEYLLDLIDIRYNYDFKHYNRDMIKRRIDSFKIQHRVKNMKDMVGIVLFNQRAFKSFFLEVSINVTELFRNPSSFSHIKELLKKSFKNAHNIKLWSAGCSNGKESYSLAILLQNLGLLNKSIIYATDFNRAVLEEAKNGIYSLEDYSLGVKNFEELNLYDTLNNYIIKNDKFVTITQEIKEKTHFFEHNLLIDGSFNEFDIIICKNVIIYFDYDLQKKVFELFYNSLKFGGYLVLGKSEAMHSFYEDKFERFPDGCKIYRKIN